MTEKPDAEITVEEVHAGVEGDSVVVDVHYDEGKSVRLNMVSCTWRTYSATWRRP